jgi:hypothetical protein
LEPRRPRRGFSSDYAARAPHLHQTSKVRLAAGIAVTIDQGVYGTFT